MWNKREFPQLLSAFVRNILFTFLPTDLSVYANIFIRVKRIQKKKKNKFEWRDGSI